MYRIIFVACLLFYSNTFAQVRLCPATFPEECTCSNDWYGSIKCLTNSLDSYPWDIKATFDEISVAINDNDTVVYEVIVDAFFLDQPQEIPGDSISSLKIETLLIDGRRKLTRIDPAAFSASWDSLMLLNFHRVEFQDAQLAFDLVNNHKSLFFMHFSYGTTLPEIPAHAISAEVELRLVTFDSCEITSIGDSAFAGPPYLNSVSLMGNSLTLENISDTAFTFAVQTGVVVYLDYNSGITHLAQEKFGYFLTNNNMLSIGCGLPGSCDPMFYLHCDERVDWFCDTDFTRVYGYICKEQQYGNIYDYCEEKFGYSPLTGQNSEELEQIQITDRNRRAADLNQRYSTLKLNS